MPSSTFLHCTLPWIQSTNIFNQRDYWTGFQGIGNLKVTKARGDVLESWLRGLDEANGGSVGDLGAYKIVAGGQWRESPETTRGVLGARRVMGENKILKIGFAPKMGKNRHLEQSITLIHEINVLTPELHQILRCPNLAPYTRKKKFKRKTK